jgi:hypothetical protein
MIKPRPVEKFIIYGTIGEHINHYDSLSLSLSLSLYSLLKGKKPQTCDVWKVIIIFFEFETKWYL